VLAGSKFQRAAAESSHAFAWSFAPVNAAGHQTWTKVSHDRQAGPWGHVAKFHRHVMIDLPIRSGHSARK